VGGASLGGLGVFGGALDSLLRGEGREEGKEGGREGGREELFLVVRDEREGGREGGREGEDFRCLV